MNLLRFLVIACLILSGYPGFGFPQRHNRRQAGQSLRPQEIAQRSVGALVSITTFLPDHKTPLAYGSGFCIGRDPLVRGNALIVTNYHVLKGSAGAMLRSVPFVSSGRTTLDSFVRSGGNTGAYYLRLVDALHDIVLLSAPMRLSALPLATKLPVAGDSVYVMGNPEGLEGSFSSGLVSAVRFTPSPQIQITAPISHGSSGGPVLNLLGQVIGIAASGLSEGQNLNFAVPSALIKAALNGYKTDPDTAIANAMETINRDKIPDWKLIEQKNSTRQRLHMYYDADSIKDIGNGQRTMWVLSRIIEDGVGEDNFMNLMAFDCVRKESTALKFYRPGEEPIDFPPKWERPESQTFIN